MKRVILIIVTVFSYLQATKIATISIEGMTCPLCATAIKRSLKRCDGVIKAKVRLNTKSAKVEYKESTTEQTLLKAIKRVGYSGKIVSVESMD